MAEPSASESSAATDSDQDFDPSAEMLVNDFDDEHTLDEEEALDGDANGVNEIDDLQKEGEMPLEELLALYGYGDKVNASTERPDRVAIEKAEATSTTNTSTAEAHSSTDASNASQRQSPAVVQHLRSHITAPFTHMNSHNLVSDSSSGESEDESFSINEEDWRRTIQVGSEYQAAIPDGLCRYDDAPAYENEDRLLWNPAHLEDSYIEEYLIRFKQKMDEDAGDVLGFPSGSHVRDDEQALYLLHQCGHNIEEALRRRRTASNLPVINETMSSWSEEECKAFEAGLRMYGKDFHQIQLNKVRTRSVGELVQFYYLWKKTERHDVFATKCRLEKKKYTLHPGTTDYMDRFLDEQENLAFSSLNNIQSSNKQLHSYRSSPLSQATSSPLSKSDMLIDELSGYSNPLTAFCDSGGQRPVANADSASAGFMSAVGAQHGTGFINGLVKNTSDSTNALCGGGNSLSSSVVDKVCHANLPPHEWPGCHPTTTNLSSTATPTTTTPTNTTIGCATAINGPDSVSQAETATTTLKSVTSSISSSLSSSSSSISDNNIHHLATAANSLANSN